MHSTKEMDVGTSRSLVVDGTVFFLVVVILITLFQVLSGSDYYFGEQPSVGGGLLGVAVVNAIAAYGSMKSKRWGFVLAFIINLIYTVGTYASTVIPPFGYSAIDALYGGIDISMRIIVMFLAMEGFRARPITGTG